MPLYIQVNRLRRKDIRLNLSESTLEHEPTGASVKISTEYAGAYRKMLLARTAAQRKKAGLEFLKLVRSAARRSAKDLNRAVRKARELNAMCHLADCCMIFADRKGKVIAKTSNPFSSNLNMSYRRKALSIAFDVMTSPFGNGSFSLTVRTKKNVVFKATGSYNAGPYDIKVERYAPGRWSDRIRKFSEKILREEK